MSRTKYRKIAELYVRGTEMMLREDTLVWVQVLNAFERDTVRNEAQIARARIVLAMKEHGSDDQARIKAGFYAEGRGQAVGQLTDNELNKQLGKIIEGVRNDPDWVKKVEILDRGLDGTAVAPIDAERDLITTMEIEYLDEIGRRAETERAFLRNKYEQMEEEPLWEAYLDSWLERQGDAVAVATYKMGLISASIRTCEGVRTEDGWDHDACNSHVETVWEGIDEVRVLPEDLHDALIEAIEALEMSEREAKNSDRQMSSSGSSQLPSEVEASTPSTQIETPATPPGISSSPSPTPSPSSDGSSSPRTISLDSPSGSIPKPSMTTSTG